MQLQKVPGEKGQEFEGWYSGWKEQIRQTQEWEEVESEFGERAVNIWVCLEQGGDSQGHDAEVK